MKGPRWLVPSQSSDLYRTSLTAGSGIPIMRRPACAEMDATHCVDVVRGRYIPDASVVRSGQRVHDQ